jgi:putative transposase
MRPSKFTDEQIVQALQQVRAGTSAVSVCRSLGITETTFYRWRKKFGARGTTDVRPMRAILDENRKLKQIVANMLLEKLRPSIR